MNLTSSKVVPTASVTSGAAALVMIPRLLPFAAQASFNFCNALVESSQRAKL